MIDGVLRGACCVAEGTPPDSFVANAWLLLLSALGGAAAVAGIWAAVRKNTVTLEPPDVTVTGSVETRKSREAVQKDICKVLHATVDRRLDEHDHQILQLRETMREEDEKTRAMLNRSFQDIERSLGRIEGKLDQK